MFTPRPESEEAHLAAEKVFPNVEIDEMGRWRFTISRDSYDEWREHRGEPGDRGWVKLTVEYEGTLYPIAVQRADCGSHGCDCAAVFKVLKPSEKPRATVCEWCGEQVPTKPREFDDEEYDVCDPCETLMWAELKKTGELPIPSFSEAGFAWTQQFEKEGDR